MNQVGKDVWRVREEQQPRPRQTQETPVPSRGASELLTGQQREDHRQPRQEQIPDEKRVAEVAGPEDSRQHQCRAGARSDDQGEDRNGRFVSKGELQESHSSGAWTIFGSVSLNVSVRYQLAGGVEDGLIEAAVEAVRADELHMTARGPKKGPQHPANLAAQKQVARQPREQDPPSYRITARPLLQQRQQAHVANYPSKRDERHQRQLQEGVLRRGWPSRLGERRSVPDDEQRHGTQRPKDGGGNREADQHRGLRLAEGDPEPEQRSQHAIEQAVAERGK